MDRRRYKRLLNGCLFLAVSLLVVPVAPGEPLSKIPPGTELVLKRPLTFSVGESRVYFQDGELVSMGVLSLWRPSCYLKRRAPFDTTFAAESNSYAVVNVQQGVADEWGQGAITFWTEINLGSVRQGIQSMRCEIWTDNTVSDAYVTEAEFVSIVGSWMYFRSPE